MGASAAATTAAATVVALSYVAAGTDAVDAARGDAPAVLNTVRADDVGALDGTRSEAALRAENAAAVTDALTAINMATAGMATLLDGTHASGGTAVAVTAAEARGDRRPGYRRRCAEWQATTRPRRSRVLPMSTWRPPMFPRGPRCTRGGGDGRVPCGHPRPVGDSPRHLVAAAAAASYEAPLGVWCLRASVWGSLWASPPHPAAWGRWHVLQGPQWRVGAAAARRCRRLPALRCMGGAPGMETHAAGGGGRVG